MVKSLQYKLNCMISFPNHVLDVSKLDLNGNGVRRIPKPQFTNKCTKVGDNVLPIVSNNFNTYNLALSMLDGGISGHQDSLTFVKKIFDEKSLKNNPTVPSSIDIPSNIPTNNPSHNIPSNIPTCIPTNIPLHNIHSNIPTNSPSNNILSNIPTCIPTNIPSNNPTYNLTNIPSNINSSNIPINIPTIMTPNNNSKSNDIYSNIQPHLQNLSLDDFTFPDNLPLKNIKDESSESEITDDEDTDDEDTDSDVTYFKDYYSD